MHIQKSKFEIFFFGFFFTGPIYNFIWPRVSRFVIFCIFTQLSREGKPPWPLSKKPLFSLKSGCFSPKTRKKKKRLSKFVSGYIVIQKKTLVVRPLKKNFFLCVSSLSELGLNSNNNKNKKNHSIMFRKKKIKCKMFSGGPFLNKLLISLIS